MVFFPAPWKLKEASNAGQAFSQPVILRRTSELLYVYKVYKFLLFKTFALVSLIILQDGTNVQVGKISKINKSGGWNFVNLITVNLDIRGLVSSGVADACVPDKI